MVQSHPRLLLACSWIDTAPFEAPCQHLHHDTQRLRVGVQCAVPRCAAVVSGLPPSAPVIATVLAGEEARNTGADVDNHRRLSATVVARQLQLGNTPRSAILEQNVVKIRNAIRSFDKELCNHHPGIRCWVTWAHPISVQC